MKINFSSKIYYKSLLKKSPLSCTYLSKSYLVRKYGGRYFAKVKRIDILSRSMEGDILESKRDLYLVQKYGGRYFEKVLFTNLPYFVVPIGITACSIIMDVALVIKTAD